MEITIEKPVKKEYETIIIPEGEYFARTINYSEQEQFSYYLVKEDNYDVLTVVNDDDSLSIRREKRNYNSSTIMEKLFGKENPQKFYFIAKQEFMKEFSDVMGKLNFPFQDPT